MYRKNQLKEELDRLRKENEWLEIENAVLKEKINTLNIKIHAKNVEMQIKNFSNNLFESVLKQPNIFLSKDIIRSITSPITVNPEDLGIKIPVDTEEKDNNGKQD